MYLYPAIDIRAGSCVRLYRGDYDLETVYGNSPADQAELFVEEGADWIHVVDLDAARSGEATNTAAIAELLRRVEMLEREKACHVRVEVGGGVRSKEAALRLFDIGVSRVVIGTAAISNPELVTDLAVEYPIAVGLDAWGSDIAVQGWKQRTGRDLFETIHSFEEAGIDAFIVTEIERDGTLSGPDLEGLAKVLATTSVPVIASGGVGKLEDLVALAGLSHGSGSQQRRLSGTIVGRAIYEQCFSVAEAISAISGSAGAGGAGGAVDGGGCCEGNES